MDEEIFEQNLKAMEKWYSDFADLIRKQEFEMDDLEVITEISWDDELIFKVRKNDRLLYLNGKRKAKKPVELWIKRLDNIHKHAPVFLLGLGNGLYLKELIKNTDESVVVVAYEPSVTIFMHMLHTVNLAEEIENRPIAFIIKGINDADFEPVMNRILSLETVEFLKHEIHPNYQELFPQEIFEISKSISKKARRIMANCNTGILFSTDYAQNQMQNMKYLCDGYNIKGLSEVVPYHGTAILVSAGPSLNKNIHELRKAKNKAFILSVDTAVKPLIHAGIMPDAFITIDPQKPVDLVEIDKVKDIPIITPVSANPEIVKAQRGKKIFYYDSSYLAQIAYMIGGKALYPLSTGGSVACSGFSLLYKMGFETIILVGQDLAYTNNRSHADGTFQEVMPEENIHGMTRVKGNYEKDLPTLGNLKTYLEWFVYYIKGMKESNERIKVINATAGGAFIEGTELMTLEKAIEEYCCEDINFEECISQIQPVFSKDERKRIVEYLHKIPKEFDVVIKNAKKLYSAYHKVNIMCKAGNVNKDEYTKQLKRIKKYSEKCQQGVAYNLISTTIILADYIVISESLYELDTVEEESKAVSEQGMKYAKVLQKCAQILKECAEEFLVPIE